MAKPNATTPYRLGSGFELDVVYHAVTSPAFFNAAGHAIESTALGDASGAWLVGAAQAIAREGAPCRSIDRAIQRVTRWHEEGKVPGEALLAVLDYADVLVVRKHDSEDQVLAELAPLLRRRAERGIVSEVLKGFESHGDFGEIADKIKRIKCIGETRSENLITLSGEEGVRATRSLRYMHRMPTGIMDLDIRTRGGLWLGAMGVVIGKFGGGKSIALGHIAGTGFLYGVHVAHLSLELDYGLVRARNLGNLTGIPYDDILNGTREAEAMEALSSIVEDFECEGMLSLGWLPPLTTTSTQAAEWIAYVEQKTGRPVDLVVIDYADKLKSPNKSDKNRYEGMETVYTDLSMLTGTAPNATNRRKRWLWTASQAKNIGRKAKRVTGDDVADSINKMRVTDAAVGIATDETQSFAELDVSKWRIGQSGYSIPGVPVDFATSTIGGTRDVRATLKEARIWRDRIAELESKRRDQEQEA